MSLIVSIKGVLPKIPDSCVIAENATIVGDVIMGENCSVWFTAVVRGDVHYIKIGNNVSIGHRAIIHGCTIHDNVLIGMGAIIMDDVIVESNSIIGAGAVVTAGTRVASGTVYAGIPAKEIKKINEELQKDLLDRISNNYILYASWIKK